MARIAQHIINEITGKAQILEIAERLHTLKRSGSSYTTTCPLCNAEKKLSITKSKDLAKCFSCNKAAVGAVSFLQVFHNYPYRDALKFIADYYHIQWEEVEGAPPAKSVPGSARRKPKKSETVTDIDKVESFRDRQLTASGLTQEDHRIRVRTDDPDKEEEIDRYVSASLNEKFEIVSGDDVCMWYITLDRRRVTYTSSNSKTRPMWRMRWQNPALHPDKNGKPMKYQSPAKSGSKLWYPTRFIHKWEGGAIFETLFFHEGEKKADKAQAHGMDSIGMMGIHNLAQDGRLPHDVELIVQRGTKRVVFMLDADYRDLGTDVKQSGANRPYSFLRAIENFQKFFFAFNNIGISLDIYFGVVRPNAENEKGIDDLLAGSGKGKENEVVRNVFHTMNIKSGEGQYVNVYNITSWTHFHFLEHFAMQNVHAFARHYRRELKEHKVFRFKNELWRYLEKPTAEEEVELAQPLSEGEKFWSVKKRSTRGGADEEVYRFNYYRCYSFLNRRGYGVYKTAEGRQYFIKNENKVIHPVTAHEIGKYVKEFVETLNVEDLMNMLYANDVRFFSETSMMNLRSITPPFLESSKGLQYFFFADKYWKVTADQISEGPLSDLDGCVWADQVSERSASRLQEPMMSVVHNPSPEHPGDLRKGYFVITTTLAAESCHFLQFLGNTSNFYRDKFLAGKPLSFEEADECSRHFLQKCTAFGYLLHTHCDPRITKAVIAMDAKISEVGTSEGRSGKSLLGKALQKLLPTVYVPGKAKDLTEDRFLLEEVEPGKTKILWIDDVRVNFDFEFFFPFITGGAKYETKGIRRTSLPPEKTPKLYICTNHAINERGGSFASRMIKLGFSDWYHDDGKGNVNTPLTEFGISFFDEWEFDQWNLFYNFAANCLQLYFQFGIIPAPNDRIEKRRLRQSIGEAFMEWADSYFDKPENLNRQIDRKVFNDDFYSAHPELRKLFTPRILKTKLIEYCQYSHRVFNPNKPSKDGPHGGDHKSGGVEYFTVGNAKHPGLEALTNNSKDPF